MTLRTRLTWLTLAAIIALVGLTVILLLWLPDGAEELLRREAQSSLQQVVKQYPEDVARLAEANRKALERLQSEAELLELSRQTEVQVEELAKHVDLAHRLAQKVGLPNLIVLDANGICRTLTPDEAKIGLRDLQSLELAKQAGSASSVFVAVPVQQNTKPHEASEDTPVLFVAMAAPMAEGKLWLLTKTPISRRDFNNLAMRRGVDLSCVQTGADTEQIKSDSPMQRLVAFNTFSGQRAVTVCLNMPENERRLIKDLLLRRIVLVSAPWTLFFLVVLIWLGWPAKGKEE